MENHKEIITKTIKELGIQPKHLGYRYIRYAVELLINDMTLIKSFTNAVYPQIAKEFDTTDSCVKSSIRIAIESGWGRGNKDFEMFLFGYSVSTDKRSPTSKDFLVTLADYILMMQESRKDVSVWKK